MKNKLHRSLLLPALLALCALHFSLCTSKAQGTAFTYQGQLHNNGSPANGFFDFEFSLFTNAAGTGTQVGSTLTSPGVGVTNGLFTTTLNFGDVFTGNATWLAISVRTNGVPPYTAMTPLQELTPAPYAIFANTASNLAGTLPASQLSGAVGNGQLADSSITISPGTGLTGGGTVALGGTTTLNNAGVLSITGNADITASTEAGAVTLGDTATSAATPNLIVKRDATGSFSASNLTLNGALTMPSTATAPDAIYSGSSLLLYDDNYGNFFGGQAGNETTGGLGGGFNTATGAGALAKNTSGEENTAYGYDALYANTTGTVNAANGAYALYSNTTGDDNTANGPFALYANTNGNFNTATGAEALNDNTSGWLNTATGDTALRFNTIGSFNTANGSGALVNNTSGSNNTATGYFALGANTTGQINTAIGNYALAQNITGSDNIALGSYAGYACTGTENIDIGNFGVAGDNYIMRIGTEGNQTNTFIAGIYGNGSSNAIPVFINSAGQLGTVGTLPAAVFSGLDTNALTLNNTSNSFSGTFSGNGSGLTSLNASQLTGGPLPSGALSGTYSGAVIFNSAGNRFTGDGSGLSNVSAASLSTGTAVGGGANNSVPSGATYAFIGGGQGNTSPGAYSFVGGGLSNDPGPFSFVVAGQGNACWGSYSGIGGGLSNIVGSVGFQPIAVSNSFIVDGKYNSITGNYSGIGGGCNNSVQQASYTFIGGGSTNEILPGADDSVIGGGSMNEIQTGANHSFIGGGSFNDIQLGAANSFIGGGEYNTNFSDAMDATISGGYGNWIAAEASYSTIGGGETNAVYTEGATDSTIAGGKGNVIEDSYAFIGGGNQNYIYPGGTFATIPGGSFNSAVGANSFAAGENANARNNNSFVWGDGTGPTDSTAANQFLVRASGGVVFDTSSGALTTISIFIHTLPNGIAGGGYTTTVTLEDYFTNQVGVAVVDPPQGWDATNVANALVLNIQQNAAFYGNRIGATWSQGIASGAFQGSGPTNATIVLFSATAWQGLTATASTMDPDEDAFTSPIPAGPASGVELHAGSGSWSTFSDRNAKERFQTVNAQTVLAEVAAMPVTTWNYKTQDKSIRHIGPMAQDFHAAFGLGENETSISTVDEGGVALAAIQGLNQKLSERDAEIQDLKQSVADLQKMMQSLVEKN
jgi:hypothetical protein